MRRDGLTPLPGTPERAKTDLLVVRFLATEVAQKHILLRKLMFKEEIRFNSNKLLSAYQSLVNQLVDGRQYIFGDKKSRYPTHMYGPLFRTVGLASTLTTVIILRLGMPMSKPDLLRSRP